MTKAIAHGACLSVLTLIGGLTAAQAQQPFHLIFQKMSERGLGLHQLTGDFAH